MRNVVYCKRRVTRHFEPIFMCIDATANATAAPIPAVAEAAAPDVLATTDSRNGASQWCELLSHF